MQGSLFETNGNAIMDTFPASKGGAMLQAKLSKQAAKIVAQATKVFPKLSKLPDADQVAAINAIRLALHEHSPFKAEPVDCVLWILADDVQANDYNPNTVAPPEMKLLEHSILQDGYTQPIVSWPAGGHYEVIDGYHRNRVGRECPEVRQRLSGYLPLTVVNSERQDRNDRIASTIRHNRARGKHKIEAMSDIVVELKRRNWSDERIARELGMDEDEILRLCQITGLEELFSDQDFSRAWDVEGEITGEDFEGLTDSPSMYQEEIEGFRSVNTGGEDRKFHTFDKWECYTAGFYATTGPKGLSDKECEQKYIEVLGSIKSMEAALEHVLAEWVNSCEHYLSNASMNRIAWLGQAAVCYVAAVPGKYRSGWSLLDKKQQLAANKCALRFLNRWLVAHGHPELSLEQARGGSRQVDLY